MQLLGPGGGGGGQAAVSLPLPFFPVTVTEEPAAMGTKGPVFMGPAVLTETAMRLFPYVTDKYKECMGRAPLSQHNNK